MRDIKTTTRFEKDLKKLSKSGQHKVKDLLHVIELLAKDTVLPVKYQDHALTGNWNHHRECHVKPDWLLIYKKATHNELLLVRTGSHSELFQ